MVLLKNYTNIFVNYIRRKNKMKKILLSLLLFVFTAFFCLSSSEARSHGNYRGHGYGGNNVHSGHGGYSGYMRHNDYYGVYRSMPYYSPISPYQIYHRPYRSYGHYYSTPYYNYYYPQPYGGLWNFNYYSY